MAEIVDIASQRLPDEAETARRRLAERDLCELALDILEEPVRWEALEQAAADPERPIPFERREFEVIPQLYGRYTAFDAIEDAITWGRLLPRLIDRSLSPWDQVSRPETEEMRKVLDVWSLFEGRVAPPPGRMARRPARPDPDPAQQYEMFGEPAA